VTYSKLGIFLLLPVFFHRKPIKNETIKKDVRGIIDVSGILYFTDDKEIIQVARSSSYSQKHCGNLNDEMPLRRSCASGIMEPAMSEQHAPCARKSVVLLEMI